MVIKCKNCTLMLFIYFPVGAGHRKSGPKKFLYQLGKVYFFSTFFWCCILVIPSALLLHYSIPFVYLLHFQGITTFHEA